MRNWRKCWNSVSKKLDGDKDGVNNLYLGKSRECHHAHFKHDSVKEFLISFDNQ